MSFFTSNYIKKIWRREIAQQGAKYILVGGLCTFLDITILFFLTEYGGVHYLVSSIVSFAMLICLNYYLCVIWIFDIRIVNNHTHEFLSYVVINLGAICINALIIWVLTYFFAVYFLFSKMVAAIITLIYNFSLRKYFLHSSRQTIT